MKHLRRIGVTLILTLVFANIAFAEEGIMYPGYNPPPPPPPSAGIMYPGKTNSSPTPESEDKTGDMATELMLNFVQNLLSLF